MTEVDLAIYTHECAVSMPADEGRLILRRVREKLFQLLISSGGMKNTKETMNLLGGMQVWIGVSAKVSEEMCLEMFGKNDVFEREVLALISSGNGWKEALVITYNGKYEWMRKDIEGAPWLICS